MNKAIVNFFFILLLLLTGCRKDHDFNRLARPDWNPELALPLINSSMSIGDILKKSGEQEFLEIDSNNMITLVYSSRLFSKKGEDFLPVPEIFTTIYDTLNRINFPFIGDMKIRKMRLSSGRLNFSVSSTDTHDVKLKLKMPYVTKSTKPFEESFFLKPKGAGTAYTSGSFDLAGYTIDFTNKGITINTILVEYMAVLISNQSKVTGNYPIMISFEDLEFDFSEGYLGKLEFDINSDTLILSEFRNWKKGTVYLENPHIGLTFRNSFGLPVTAEITTFEAWSDVGGARVIPVTSSANIDKPFTLKYPGLNDIGQAAQTSYKLNEGNSNIKNVISISPKQLRFALFFTGNAETDTSQPNFITPESEISIDFDLKLPLHGRIDGVLLQDTFQFDVSTEKILNKLETAIFKLQTENKFPLDVKLQIYFADSKYNLLDSLLAEEETILKSGRVNNKGMVIVPSEKRTFINFDILRSANINKATNIILKVRLNTVNEGETSIKFYSDYFLGVKLGVIANPHLN